MLTCLCFAHNCIERKLRLLLSGSKAIPLKSSTGSFPRERVESGHETRGMNTTVVIRVLSWCALLQSFFNVPFLQVGLAVLVSLMTQHETIYEPEEGQIGYLSPRTGKN